MVTSSIVSNGTKMIKSFSGESIQVNCLHLSRRFAELDYSSAAGVLQEYHSFTARSQSTTIDRKDDFDAAQAHHKLACVGLNRISWLSVCSLVCIF